MKKIKEVLKMSVITSFCLTFLLILVNSVMGIFIKLNYYGAIFLVLSLGFMVGLIVYNKGNFFPKKKKAAQMTVVKSKTAKTNKPVKVQKQVKRRIS